MYPLRLIVRDVLGESVFALEKLLVRLLTVVLKNILFVSGVESSSRCT